MPSARAEEAVSVTDAICEPSAHTMEKSEMQIIATTHAM